MNIYFAGIGGVGIGPLAEIASDAGNYIAGSDAAKSPITHQLEAKGVEIAYVQDGSFVEHINASHPLDWFIYTAAMPEDHPELIKARELGIKTGKRDELLSDIIREHNLKLIAIAGTHGKTTTTGMLVWALKQLGVPVSYSVGSTLNFGPSGQFDKNAHYFVYECDEYDRNFLHFSPFTSVITAVDYDHPDTYPTRDDYNAAFRQFIHQSETAILWQADAERIGIRNANTWCMQGDEVLPLHLAGEHNRRNATLVLKALERLKIGEAVSNREAVESFPGTNRRFEKLVNNLYSDYGHHPIEIAATLQMARELNNHVVLVYQPHQNIRQHEIKDQYNNCMELAQQVYWLPTYLSREDPNLPILTPQQLTQNLINRSAVEYRDLNDILWADIQRERALGNLVVVMGAGTVDGWLRDQLTKEL